MSDAPTQVPIPALLRASRGAYSHAIRVRLGSEGLDDLPRNGPHFLGGMANHGVAPAYLIRELGISKQAASQLIDTMVARGYFTRTTDSEDRRRLELELTDRGRAAAAATREAVLAVDSQLAQILSPAELDGLRSGLEALCEIRERAEL
jgi:DNA-binding MarR family transcriptional regulator